MELIMVDVEPGQAAMRIDVAPLIRALRPGLGQREFAEFAEEAHRQGLLFTAAYDPAGRCVGVATHRVLATSRGRLLFVDDLVTEPGVRSGGVGTRLVEELHARARRAGCARIELDSGMANHGAHRFYHAQRMSIVALHFAKDLSLEP
ncbi:GNAT family N-acetyltransferase [Kitasatospora sp. NBC_00315]|uniref:GNAT family N-acetyltransferase n=1 Tax=Kitasatospora sp. NBC_00315 TaxID=2975963 RepID=UPI0032430F85